MNSGFTSDVGVTIAEKLKSARDAAGLSTREVAARLAARLSISHATIANYEKRKTTPSLEVLCLLAGLYGKPINWFLEGGPTLSGVRYRNAKSRVRTGDRHAFEAKAQHWLEAYVHLENRLGRPLIRTIASLEPSATEPEADLAARVRREARIPLDGPIPSVVSLLEAFGVRAIELPTDLRIDGLAARFGDEFVVVLNPTISHDRCRMNAAHELAHVLFGDCHTSTGLTEKEIERRAYGLASHLILPQEQLVAAFQGRSFVRLVQFKERFGISIAAMVYRAEQSGIIDRETAKWLWIEFSKRGWRRKEPGYVRPDRAIRFELLLDEAVSEGKLTWRQAASFMGVREEELQERLNFALGIMENADDEEGGDFSPTIKMRP